MASRAEIQSHARYLVQGGMSRRRMDAALKSEYGHSIGRATFTKLLHERVQQIVERERATFEPKVYKPFKKRKQSAYQRLIADHFLPEEAHELAKKLHAIGKINEIKIMTNAREKLYKQFVRMADRENYSGNDFRDFWRETVFEWYEKHAIAWRKAAEFWHIKQDHVLRNKWTVKKGRQITITQYLKLMWSWFGHVKSQLPEKDQYFSPGRKKREKQKQVDVRKASLSAEINTNKRLRDQNPERRAYWQEKIDAKTQELKELNEKINLRGKK